MKERMEQVGARIEAEAEAEPPSPVAEAPAAEAPEAESPSPQPESPSPRAEASFVREEVWVLHVRTRAGRQRRITLRPGACGALATLARMRANELSADAAWVDVNRRGLFVSVRDEGGPEGTLRHRLQDDDVLCLGACQLHVQRLEALRRLPAEHELPPRVEPQEVAPSPTPEACEAEASADLAIVSTTDLEAAPSLETPAQAQPEAVPSLETPPPQPAARAVPRLGPPPSRDGIFHRIRRAVAKLGLEDRAQAAAAAAPEQHELRLGEPLSWRNFKVFPLLAEPFAHFDGRLLSETMDESEVKVVETSQVNELRLRNGSAQVVLGLLGELVRGGRQDRVLPCDVLVPAHTEVPLPAFCVESDRWAPRGSEDAARFRATETLAPSSLRTEMAHGSNQGRVWSSVASFQQTLSGVVGRPMHAARSRSSMVLTLHECGLEAELEPLLEQLRALDPNALGYLVANPHGVEHAECFASAELFQRVVERLRRGLASDLLSRSSAAENHQTAADCVAWLREALTAPVHEHQASGSAKLVERRSTQSGVRLTVGPQRELLHLYAYALTSAHAEL